VGWKHALQQGQLCFRITCWLYYNSTFLFLCSPLKGRAQDTPLPWHTFSNFFSQLSGRVYRAELEEGSAAARALVLSHLAWFLLLRGLYSTRVWSEALTDGNRRP
jgi:hypothetical protein